MLLVDDERDFAEVVLASLDFAGYKTFYAPTGEEAIEIVKKEEPDVILLDVRLPKPGIDGIETLRRIREFNSKVKVILISGLEKSINVDAEKLGIDSFMPKPLNISQLKEKISSLLSTPK